jgi:hypothetical protein
LQPRLALPGQRRARHCFFVNNIGGDTHEQDIAYRKCARGRFSVVTG